jgi:hypothetical protein
LLFRRFKLEAEIASMIWKVHWEDVFLMTNAKTRGSMYSLGVANKFRNSQLVSEITNYIDYTARRYLPSSQL